MADFRYFGHTADSRDEKFGEPCLGAADDWPWILDVDGAQRKKQHAKYGGRVEKRTPARVSEGEADQVLRKGGGKSGYHLDQSEHETEFGHADPFAADITSADEPVHDPMATITCDSSSIG